MLERGAEDSRNGNPSLAELARMSGVATSTVARLILHGGKVSQEKLEAIAEALDISAPTLLEWCTGERVNLYSPPAGAERLNVRERRLVDELIRVLVENKEDTSGGTQKKTVDPKRSKPDQKISQAKYGLAARNKPGLRDLDEPR